MIGGNARSQALAIAAYNSGRAAGMSSLCGQRRPVRAGHLSLLKAGAGPLARMYGTARLAQELTNADHHGGLFRYGAGHDGRGQNGRHPDLIVPNDEDHQQRGQLGPSSAVHPAGGACCGPGRHDHGDGGCCPRQAGAGAVRRYFCPRLWRSATAGPPVGKPG